MMRMSSADSWPGVRGGIFALVDCIGEKWYTLYMCIVVIYGYVRNTSDKETVNFNRKEVQSDDKK